MGEGCEGDHMRDYWLCVTTKDNWEIIRKKKLWGVSKGNREVLNRAKPGDFMIFYIKGKIIGGTFEVISDPFYDEKKVFDTRGHVENETFPFRVHLKPLILPHNHVKIEKIVDHVRFISNKEKWTAHFRRAMRKIPKEDYERILAVLKKT